MTHWHRLLLAAGLLLASPTAWAQESVVDSPAGATDTGIPPHFIRDDSLATLSPADGDYVQGRVNSRGALWVAHDGTASVDTEFANQTDGATAGTTGIHVLGTDGTNAQIIKTDTTGSVQVDCESGCSGGTQFAEDAAHTTGDLGTQALAVRKDAAGPFGADGDYTPLQTDANGALRVTGGGGGTEYTVNGVTPADPTGGTFVMERDDALSALSEVEGDWTNPRSNANGALWVAHDGTVTVGDGSGALTVDGTVNAAQSGTWTVQPGNTANTTPWLATIAQGGNSATVSAGGNLNVTSRGVDAHDAAVSGSPNLVGGYASAAAPADVSADGDVARAWFLRNGSPVVNLAAGGTLITGDGPNGLDVDVTRLPALVAGTANIGDVDVATIAAGDNNIGNVDVVSSALPTGASTLAEQQTQTTALQIIDDIRKNEDDGSANLDPGVVLLARRTATPANTSGADLDYEALQMAAGRLWTSATIDAAIPAGTNNIGDVDVLTLPAIPAGTNNIGDVDVLTFPDNEPINVAQMNGVAVTMGNGASGTGVQRVTIANDSTGEVNQDTASAFNAEVQGDAAHDAGVSGNPVLAGGYAEIPDDSAPGNQVSADADATRFITDRDGVQYVRTHGPRLWESSAEYSTQQTDTSIRSAVASTKNYITDIFVSCNGAVTVTLEDDEGTDDLLFRHYCDAAGSGAALHFTTPIQTAANQALLLTTSAAVTVTVVVTGYSGP